MDIAQFRLDFTQFADEDVYTDSMCTYWSNQAEKLNSEAQFGEVYNDVIELYTAHCITLQAGEIATANQGGFPAGMAGAVTSKKVGDVSVNYDSQYSFENDAGWFNLTIYGRQYLQLKRMYGKGGFMAGFNGLAGAVG